MIPQDSDGGRQSEWKVKSSAGWGKNQKKQKTVWLVTSYGVTQSDGSQPGNDTAFMQPKRLLTTQGKANPRPKDEWIADLIKQIKA